MFGRHHKRRHGKRFIHDPMEWMRTAHGAHGQERGPLTEELLRAIATALDATPVAVERS